jgi:hypothetical protein
MLINNLGTNLIEAIKNSNDEDLKEGYNAAIFGLKQNKKQLITTVVPKTSYLKAINSVSNLEVKINIPEVVINIEKFKTANVFDKIIDDSKTSPAYPISIPGYYYIHSGSRDVNEFCKTMSTKLKIWRFYIDNATEERTIIHLVDQNVSKMSKAHQLITQNNFNIFTDTWKNFDWSDWSQS